MQKHNGQCRVSGGMTKYIIHSTYIVYVEQLNCKTVGFGRVACTRLISLIKRLNRALRATTQPIAASLLLSSEKIRE
jgi:hypothetical protein